MNLQRIEWSLMNTPEAKLLIKNTDIQVLRKLIIANPGMVDFTTMPSCDKRQLLHSDFAFYKNLIDLKSLTHQDQIALAFSYPNLMCNTIAWNVVSATQRSSVALKRPTWFKKYNIPVAGLSTDAWEKLINYKNHEYIPRFLDSLTEFTNKTTLRGIFYRFPFLLKHLTVDQMQNSILTSREWLLLLNTPKISGANGKYSDEVNRWLEHESLCVVLDGSATNTRFLKMAREKVSK